MMCHDIKADSESSTVTWYEEDIPFMASYQLMMH